MFERISPEEAGLSSRYVKELLRVMDHDFPMHSMLILKGEKIISETYWAPYTPDSLQRMYSQTKSFTSIAIGLLAQEGKIHLDDKIVDYFPEKIHTEISPLLKEQTIRDMLEMRTCGDTPYWFTAPDPDRTSLYMNYMEATHRPGTSWCYDSAGSQVLGALVEKVSGERLFDFLYKRVFSHLGTFQSARILKTRNGDSWADSGMLCTTRDIASFGRFVMNQGMWHGERLMDAQYLKEATSAMADNHIYSFTTSQSVGYGYQIWLQEGGFSFRGMGGQDTMCYPDQDVIIVTTADTQDFPYFDEWARSFREYVLDRMEDHPLPEDPEALEALKQFESSRTLSATQGLADSPLRAQVDGKRFVLQGENLMGWKEFTLHFNGSEGELEYVNAQGRKTLPFGLDHNVFGQFPQLGYADEQGGIHVMSDFKLKDAVSGSWEPGDRFFIRVQVIDKYLGNVAIFFDFKGADYCTVKLEKFGEDILNEYRGIGMAVQA